MMTEPAYDPAASLGQLVADGKISTETVGEILAVPEGQIVAFLRDPTDVRHFSGRDGSMLLLLAESLTVGLDGTVDDDERLKAILEGLVQSFHFTPDQLSALLRVDQRDVEAALEDPNALPLETRYALGLRASFLMSIINQTRQR